METAVRKVRNYVLVSQSLVKSGQQPLAKGEGSERICELFEVPQLPSIRQRIRTEAALGRASIPGWRDYCLNVFPDGWVGSAIKNSTALKVRAQGCPSWALSHRQDIH